MELCGTYKLISWKRQIVETGHIETFRNTKGLIMYDQGGRFLVLMTDGDRPKPESIATMTDQQRSDLHRTMFAYGGTFTFDGKMVEHHIDLSWNEVWTGTTVIREVKVEGDQLIYTSRPAPFAGDGKLSVGTVVWEKVN
jgi:hypothetical protein